MQPVSLALMWHQHQPYYPDDVSGETLMPWVRLHGTKDYIGMALHIEEVPEFRCTINLVPSLLVQIQRYVDGGSDRHLDLSRVPADGLSEDEAVELLDNFFMANVDHLIRPFPRYYELYLRRGPNPGPGGTRAALTRFNEADFRDIQVWNNLTWIHELVFEKDTELAEFRRQGKRWSETDKQWLLDRQREIMAQIIPLHRKLMEGGQVELTTTPFYHPILPLLWDKRSARQAMPGCELPRYLDKYPEDVVRHLERAVAYHTELFGAPPTGLWPSEGSVSQDILGAIADCGIRWVATDEEILAHSTDGLAARDSQGFVKRPDKLYQPWIVEHEGKTLQMIFRDHALSDQIGFHYQRAEPVSAADDLLNRVVSIGQAVARHVTERPAFVPIILDGENCWEYYPDGGVAFLRRLYRESVRRKDVQPVRVADHLKAHPARDRIHELFAGSWIFHNFAIWIGHREDRDAWDALHETRRFLRKQEESGEHAAEDIRRAWTELDIAEGSDWFWWYGDDHSSALDDLFDQLFRRHLENVYNILGASPPASLARAIGGTQQRVSHTQPRGFLDITLDGRQTTYFEWNNAGNYIAGSERGTMTMVQEGLIRELHFGFSESQLFLRIDTTSRAIFDLSEADSIRIRFVEPEETELVIESWKNPKQTVSLLRNGQITPLTKAESSLGTIFELSTPFVALDLAAGQPLSFFIEVFAEGRSIDRVPSEGTVDLTVPSPSFEAWNWLA